MRKLLLLIVTLSLGIFALAQTSNSGSGDMQSAGNDWYNQHLSSQVEQFDRIAAATTPSATLPQNQAGTLPQSIAANAGQAGNDWYNQVLGQQIQEFDRLNAAASRTATAGQ